MTCIPICLLHSSPGSLTETFIRAHAERLPGRVTVVHRQGDVVCVGGKPVLSQHILSRGRRAVWREMMGGQLDELSEAYVKVFRQTGAKVVLAEYGPVGINALAACRKAGIPLVVHFHGYDASIRTVLEECHSGYQRLFQEAAAIVVVSRAMERRLLALGASSSRLFYNPYGADCSVFAGASPEQARPTFLSVGRFVEKKAPHLTIMAFARIVDSYPDARLRMIGDGPLWGTCNDLVQALGLQDRVILLGPRSHAQVLGEMQDARGFVQHSVEASNGDCEGTPVAILEASAAGLPVVSTAHAGIPDVIVHRETGLLVDERDTAGMAEAMVELLDDPAYAGRLGAAGRERIARRFSMQQSIESLWNILLGTMEQMPPAQRTPTAVYVSSP